jgi:hypothetical protein
LKLKLLEVLTNPNAFFAAKLQDAMSLRVPALLVLISGLISGIAAYMITGITLEMLQGVLPPEAQSIAATVGGVSAFLGAVVFSLLLWVIYAAVFFGISALFKGEGEFKRTLEFVGYGYIPIIIGGIISAILMYNFVATAQLPHVTDPAALAEVITQWITSSPTVLLSSIIGILFMIWAANIWIFGLKHARNLSTKHAAITVGIPVAAYILYSVWQLGVLW